MTTGVMSWSKTAASNATADSTVNWQEGQAPSSINDSARAEMASVAKWRDDFNGSITTSGSSTAYTVTTNQTMTALVNSLLAFVPHATNGATVTIAVDSIGAKPLRSAPGVELAAGVLVQGTPYAASYYTTNGGEWILCGLYGNPYNTPVGGFMPYVSTTAPNSSFALPYGQAISRTTYSALFALTSTIFGIGDGSTTFNLPDLRGRAVFGLDNMGGSTAGRITNSGSSIVGTTPGATGGSEAITISVGQLPTFTPTGVVTRPTITVSSPVFNPTQLVGSGSGASTLGVGTTPLNISASLDNDPHFTGDPIGSGQSVIKMPPAIILPWLLRII